MFGLFKDKKWPWRNWLARDVNPTTIPSKPETLPLYQLLTRDKRTEIIKLNPCLAFFRTKNDPDEID